MLRTPLRALYTKNLTTTASLTDTFVLPFSDFDNLVAKFTLTSLNTGNGASGNLVLFIQTTDDGGSTYYDSVAFATLTESSTMTNAASEWVNIPILGGSTTTQTTAADAGFWGANQGKGIPLLTNQVRFKWVFNNMAATGVVNGTLQILTNQQSSHIS